LSRTSCNGSLNRFVLEPGRSGANECEGDQVHFARQFVDENMKGIKMAAHSPSKIPLWAGIFLSLVSTAALSLLLSAPATADEIYFKSGFSHTGVIIRENEDIVTFKTEMGVSTISRDKIDFIEKATPEENQLLLKQWREEAQKLKDAQKARHEAERAFEAEQRAKGMIQFEGKWVTPQEKERILDLRRQAVEDRKQFEQRQREKGLVRFQKLWVTKENARELREMEPKIYSLYDDINSRKRTIDSLRSRMTGVSTLDEAEDFSQRIEELNQQIAEANERLGKLLQRADEIEAASVHYVLPEKFREAMAPESTEQ
jgi:hypothetical protein